MIAVLLESIAGAFLGALFGALFGALARRALYARMTRRILSTAHEYDDEGDPDHGP